MLGPFQPLVGWRKCMWVGRRGRQASDVKFSTFQFPSNSFPSSPMSRRYNTHELLAVQVATTWGRAFSSLPLWVSWHPVELSKGKTCDLGTERELHSEPQVFETWNHKLYIWKNKTQVVGMLGGNVKVHVTREYYKFQALLWHGRPIARYPSGMPFLPRSPLYTYLCRFRWPVKDSPD